MDEIEGLNPIERLNRMNERNGWIVQSDMPVPDVGGLSMSERFHRMDTLQKQGKMQQMRQFVQAEYSDAFRAFMRNLEGDPGPYDIRYFLYPDLFFYLKDPGRQDTQICTIMDFQYGSYSRSHMITKKTFSAFLQNQCMLPPMSNHVTDALFDALGRRLREFPRTGYEVLLEHLKQSDPQLAMFLSMPQSVCLSREQNLIFNIQAIRAAIRGPYSHFCPIPWKSVLEEADSDSGDYLLFEELRQRKASVRLMQKVFRELNRELSSKEGCHLDHEADRYDHEAVFAVGASGSEFISAYYQPSSDSFASVKRDWQNFQIKHFPLHRRFADEPVSDTILTFFRTLCGNYVAGVNSLARFLSRAMDPALPGMTVIYTKQHPEQLKAVMCELFQDCWANLRLDQKRDRGPKLPSLNQLAKPTALKRLFVEQMNSKSVVFVRDLAASDKNLRKLRWLLKGRAVQLKSPYFPPQRYCNKLHLVCVSDDPVRVKVLQKQFRLADVIDLSICEEEESLPELTEHDYHWLRSTFSLYGLKLRTLENLQIPDPAAPAQTAPLPNLALEITAFLQSCRQGKDLHCDTFQLYDGFVAFYRERTCGTNPAITKVKFNKQVRAMLGKCFGRAVVYRKRRKSGVLKWWYIGITLPQVSAQPIPKQPSALESYLRHINTYKLSNDFHPVLNVRIKRSLPEGANQA